MFELNGTWGLTQEEIARQQGIAKDLERFEADQPDAVEGGHFRHGQKNAILRRRDELPGVIQRILRTTLRRKLSS